MKNAGFFLLLFLAGCLQPLEAPGPDWQPQTFAEGPPALAFTHRASSISPGSVRFRNYSSGILEFTWYFGFNDEEGYEVTSHTPAPTIKYPGNGRYNVRLHGFGTDSINYWVTDLVEINNIPD